MNTDGDGFRSGDITNLIIKGYYIVYNALGYGFLEKVYANALAIELRKLGLTVVREAPISIYYDGSLVGEYYADLLVNNTVLVELKAVSELRREHEAQLLNYLKATRYEVGLLMNFGPTPKFERRIYDNDLKGSMRWLPELSNE
jgi:GxxExxY protein